MFNLAMAILCSTVIAVLMRVSSSYIKNNMTMFTANYLACIACSVFFLIKDNPQFTLVSSASGLKFALFLGAISGVMYLLSFVLLQLNIKRNGVILASTFMKMGVLVPVLMAIIFFSEKPTLFQLLGFILALVAIVIINSSTSSDTDESGASKHSIALLVVLLIAGGFTDSTANIFDKLGNVQFKNHFLLCTFAVAMISSIVGVLIKKQKFTPTDFLWGLGIGIPNYFSSRFLLHSLSTVSAIVAYPVYNVATILLISSIGLLIFKEKIDIRKTIGIILILFSIVFEIL